MLTNHPQTPDRSTASAWLPWLSSCSRCYDFLDSSIPLYSLTTSTHRGTHMHVGSWTSLEEVSHLSILPPPTQDKTLLFHQIVLSRGHLWQLQSVLFTDNQLTTPLKEGKRKKVDTSTEAGSSRRVIPTVWRTLVAQGHAIPFILQTSTKKQGLCCLRYRLVAEAEVA